MAPIVFLKLFKRQKVAMESHKLNKSKRYFDLFNTQFEFFLAKLDEEFFIANHLLYKDIWAKPRKSCLRLLLSHRDCPPQIRILYTKHPKVEVRALAYFGYYNNYRGGADFDFVISQQNQILSDKANSIRKTYLENFFLIKLINIIVDSPISTDISQSTNNLQISIFSCPIDQKTSFFLKQVQNNIQKLTDGPTKELILKDILTILNNKVFLDSFTAQQFSELVKFLQDPVMGLISTAPMIRQIAGIYYRQTATT